METQTRSDTHDLNKRTLRLYEEGNYAEAISLLEEERNRSGCSVRLLRRLANCYLMEKRYEDAVRTYTEVIRRVPDQGSAYAFLGEALRSSKNFPAAQKAYAKALEYEYDPAWLHRNKAYMEIELGEYEAAQKHAEEAVRSDPDNLYGHQIAASAAWYLRQWPKALLASENMVRLIPDDTKALLDVAALHAFLGNSDAARTTYLRLLEQNPESDEARQWLDRNGARRLPWPLRTVRVFWGNVRADFRTMIVRDPFAEDVDFQNFARIAYKRCVDWFGEPSDPEREYDLRRGLFSRCAYSWVTKSYLITIAEGEQSQADRYGTLGHEMYHRVTMRARPLRRSLRRFMWVDELLAMHAEFHLLRENGMVEMADDLIRRYQEETNPMSVARITRARRRRFFRAYARKEYYPPGFGGGLVRLGQELEKAVGWDALRRLTRCRTWNEWLATLPDADRSAARRLLDL